MSYVKNLDINGSTYDIKSVAVNDVRSGNAIKTWTGTKAQYEAITTKDSNTLYFCTDSGEIYLGSNLIANNEINQSIDVISSGAIALTNNISIYKITPSSATTFTFNTSNLSLSSSESYTFELCIDMSTVQTLTFPSSVKWLYDEAPDLSEAGTYFLVFRTIDGGTTWLGNLQGKWS